VVVVGSSVVVVAAGVVVVGSSVVVVGNGVVVDVDAGVVVDVDGAGVVVVSGNAVVVGSSVRDVEAGGLVVGANKFQSIVVFGLFVVNHHSQIGVVGVVGGGGPVVHHFHQKTPPKGSYGSTVGWAVKGICQHGTAPRCPKKFSGGAPPHHGGSVVPAGPRWGWYFAA
jgi:hypothetical protein